MKRELTKLNITEFNYDSNIAYLFDDYSLFSETGYKFLQTQEEFFVPCKGLMFNGKKKLIYFTENYKCLKDIINSFDIKKTLSILMLLVKTVINIKNIGFLPCDNINISLDRIFWDIKGKSIKLIYLPINKKISANKEYEDVLKRLIVETISSNMSFSIRKSSLITEWFLDENISLEDLYRKLYEVYKLEIEGVDHEAVKPEYKKQLFLTNVADGKKLIINKNDFIIGKSANSDGVITGNGAVSRKHCKIIICDDKFSVIDLESSNGTYLNDLKLSPNEAYQLHNGDKLRLANSKWTVEL